MNGTTKKNGILRRINMGLRAFTRHAVEKELTLRDNYRRLRIL